MLRQEIRRFVVLFLYLEGETMKIRVIYWRGTTECEGFATTYCGAMRIASRNQNAYQPRYFDDDGRQLYDDGNGLRYEDADAYAV